jgi:hypothetical protein
MKKVLLAAVIGGFAASFGSVDCMEKMNQDSGNSVAKAPVSGSEMPGRIGELPDEGDSDVRELMLDCLHRLTECKSSINSALRKLATLSQKAGGVEQKLRSLCQQQGSVFFDVYDF